ncbi:MAG TPA: CPBP family intramembrane glutamic endopeptidase [Thermoanaerobaculia bacterium]|jgi:membrane protease YdiL (CAAX protease family)
MVQRALSAPRLWGEVAGGFVLVQAALWTEGPARSALALAAAAGIMVAVAFEQPSLAEVGLGRAGLARSAWVVAAAAGLAGAMLLAGKLAGSGRHPFQTSALAHLAAYVPWSLAQQFAAQSFFYRRLEVVVGARKAVGVTALLFSAAHLPNPVLAPATLAAGLLFSEVFRRYHNLYPLAVAHALLALAIAVAVPNHLHRHMHVGIGYLRYRPVGTSSSLRPGSDRAKADTLALREILG